MDLANAKRLRDRHTTRKPRIFHFLLYRPHGIIARCIHLKNPSYKMSCDWVWDFSFTAVFFYVALIARNGLARALSVLPLKGIRPFYIVADIQNEGLGREYRYIPSLDFRAV